MFHSDMSELSLLVAVRFRSVVNTKPTLTEDRANMPGFRGLNKDRAHANSSFTASQYNKEEH